MEEHLRGRCAMTTDGLTPREALRKRKGWLDVPICGKLGVSSERLLGAHCLHAGRTCSPSSKWCPPMTWTVPTLFAAGAAPDHGLWAVTLPGRVSRGQTGAGHFERFVLRHLFQSAEMAPRPGASSPWFFYYGFWSMTRGCRHPVRNSIR